VVDALTIAVPDVLGMMWGAMRPAHGHREYGDGVREYSVAMPLAQRMAVMALAFVAARP
jgi:hypothetical protein